VKNGAVWIARIRRAHCLAPPLPSGRRSCAAQYGHGSLL